MERLMQQRQQLSHALDKAQRKYEAAVKHNESDSVICDLQDEIDDYSSNIKYLNDNVDEIQTTITQIEDAKEEAETIDIGSVLPSVPGHEVKYLFDKLLAMVINQSLLASQREEERREFELKYKQVIDTSLVQEQLLHHVLETTFIDIPTKEDMNFAESEPMPRSFLSNDHQFTVPMNTVHLNEPPPSPSTRGEKARRLTKTPAELLFETTKAGPKEDIMTQSLRNDFDVHLSEIPRIPSAPSLK